MKKEKLYAELKNRLSELDIFSASTSYYMIKSGSYIFLYLTLYTLSLAFINRNAGLEHFFTALCAIISIMTGVICHDATHGVLHPDKRINNFIGMTGFNLFNGNSYNLWAKVHANHHKYTQVKPGEHMEGDPDLKDNMWLSPFLEAAERKTGFVRTMNRYQGYYFFLIAPFYALALRVEGISHILKNMKNLKIEIMFILGHIALWLVIPALYSDMEHALVRYLVFSMVTSLHLVLVFLPNHGGMRFVKQGQKYPTFVDRIECSRNIRNWRIFDPLFGGLNYHIEHHLFPTIAADKLRKGQKTIMEFCQEHDIKYTCVGYGEAVKSVLANLFFIGKSLEKKRGKSIDEQSRILPDVEFLNVTE